MPRPKKVDNPVVERSSTLKELKEININLEKLIELCSVSSDTMIHKGNELQSFISKLRF